MRPGKVIARLVEVAPPVIAQFAKPGGRCIMATKIGIGVLAKFGIEAVPLPVGVQFANKAMLDWRAEVQGAWDDDEAAVLAERDRRGAWMLAVGQTVNAEGRGWNGHLILHVPALGRAIDLDVRQFSRPAKRIFVPDAWEFPWRDLTNIAGLQSPNGCLVEYEHEPTNLSYQTGGDWQHAYPLVIGEIAAQMRKLSRVLKEA